MIKHIAAISGVHNSHFKSLYESPSLSVTGGGTSAWDDTGTWLTGVDQRDFELSFDLPTLLVGEQLGVAMRASDISWGSYTGASFVIEALGSSQYRIGLYDGGGDSPLSTVTIDEPPDGATFRLVGQGEFFTLHINEYPVWTFHTTLFQGTTVNNLGFSFYNGSSISLSNVRVPELGERREAGAVDVNNTALQSIGGVLEDRPVEIMATEDGGFRTSYFDSRDDAGSLLTGGVLTEGIYVEQIIPTDSDFFSVVQVYCEDVVEVMDADLAREGGFVFYPMSASSMSVAEGLKEANRVITRAKELRETRSIQSKAMLHIERGDLLPISYDTPDGQSIDETVIVNDIVFKFLPANFSMQIGARKQAT
jgi:hypothetical protein